MVKTRTYSVATREAGRLLGARIRLARQERRWTLEELAERVGVTRKTVHRIENGDLGVGLGLAFEAATIVGVPLFDDDPARRRLEARRLRDQLAVLPRSVRKRVSVDDDF